MNLLSMTSPSRAMISALPLLNTAIFLSGGPKRPRYSMVNSGGLGLAASMAASRAASSARRRASSSRRSSSADGGGGGGGGFGGGGGGGSTKRQGSRPIVRLGGSRSSSSMRSTATRSPGRAPWLSPAPPV